MHRHLSFWIVSCISLRLVAAPIPVPNGDFETVPLADGGFTIFTDPSWTTFGGVGYGAGVFNPTTTQYASEAPQGQNVGWMVVYNSAGLLQLLSETYQAGNSYTLSALVGDRDDYALAEFHVGLFADGILVSDGSSPAPPEGGFTLVSTTFDADGSVDGLPIEVRLYAYASGDVDPDQDPGAGGSVVDFDDVKLEVTPTVTAAPSARAGFVLHQPFPNPFNPRTTLAFELSESGPVRLAVYDASGRRVRELVRGELVAVGRHDVEWNGRDDLGRPVASGVYFARLEAADSVATVRMVLVE